MKMRHALCLTAMAALPIVGVASSAHAEWKVLRTGDYFDVSTNGRWLFAVVRGSDVRLTRIDLVDTWAPDQLLRTWPAGTWVRVRAPQRDTPDSLFAMVMADSLQVLRSGDAGNSWDDVFDYECEGEGAGLEDLSATPGHPSRLLLLTYERPYRSLDGGETWQPTTLPHEEFFCSDSDPCFCDLGNTWNPVQASTHPDVLWFTLHWPTMDYELYRSQDGGATWASMDYDFWRHVRMDIDPTDHQRVYKWGVENIQRSDDGGDTFGDILDVPGDCAEYPTLVVLDPADGDVVFASTCGNLTDAEGLDFSTDGGDTWADFDRTGLPAVGDIDIRLVDYAENRRLFATSDDALWMWTEPVVGVPPPSAASIELSIHVPAVLPASSFVAVSLDAPVAGSIALSIYDVSGRRLGAPHTQTVAVGRQRVEFELPPSPGVYFLRASLAGHAATRRLVVID